MTSTGAAEQELNGRDKRMMRHLCTRRNLIFGLLCCGVAWCGNYAGYGQAVPASNSLTLKGESSGGVLTLMKAPGGWNNPYVAVTNKPGEGAGSAISRLALELANCSACAERYGGNPVREIRDDALVLSGPSPWIFGGTETGFGIPPPPTSVCASYDASTDKVIIEWTNPPGGYDSITIVYYGTPLAVLPGNAMRYVHDRKAGLSDSGFSSADILVFVTGQKGGTPSNGAGVRLRNHVQQESLMNVPFTQGTAPGFQTWTHNTAAGSITFEQGNLPGMAPDTDVRKFQGKGFYQVLKGRGTFCGGVSRRFLGLRPGHIYRVGTRMNTLKSQEGKWSFSFHAAYNPANGVNLTPSQMAGLDELPEKSKGRDAGLIARLDAGSKTDGKWVGRFSGKSSGDIVIPSEGVTAITVWFRLEGTDVPNSVVGFDSVTIEDLGGR